MDALIRETRVGTQGIDEFRDTEYSGDVLTIGSAPDRSIQFLGAEVAPRHAELRPTGSGVELRCESGRSVRIGGENVQKAELTVGDSFEIGSNRITLFEPPGGFDIGLQVEPDRNIDAAIYETAFRTEFDQVWWSNRRLAWALVVGMLLAFIIVPIALLQWGGENPPAYLPTDNLWTSGPLHPAHVAAIGDDCSVCHSVLFQRVQDDTCIDCHATAHDHVAAATLVAVPDIGATPRCATCHREHHEPEPMLVIEDDGLCAGCHADDRLAAADIGVERVHGFSPESHPAFSATLWRAVATPAGTGLRFAWKTETVPVESASEASNLKFPHQTHLDETLVSDERTGEALQCADCHVLSLDREHFTPISMAGQCVDCHELTFDPTMPDRQLPHGQPREVMLTLEGQYLRRFSDPDTPQDAVVRRRIPDRDNTTRECTGTAFACATAAASDEIREQFTAQGCVSCHIVEEYPSAEIYARYQVHPVRLTEDYFPAGNFDHASHRVIRDKTGDEACLHCHAAKASEESSDLLIPGIDTCFECHRDVAGAGQVAMQCIDCHNYHPFQPSETVRAEAQEL